MPLGGSFKQALSKGRVDNQRVVEIEEAPSQGRNFAPGEVVSGVVKNREVLETLRKNFDSIGRTEVVLIYLGDLKCFWFSPLLDWRISLLLRKLQYGMLGSIGCRFGMENHIT